MESTTIKIQTDSETVKKAEKLFSEFGLTVTTAINMFLIQSVKNQTIPFEYVFVK